MTEKFATGKAECRICGKTWVATFEFEMIKDWDGKSVMGLCDDLECPNCHNMSGEFEDQEGEYV